MSFLEPDMYDPKAIEAAIAAHLPCLHVQVEGKDGVHFTGLVVSEAFRGKRKVQLAAALASGAPLTLNDEPEAALDWPSIRYLREALAPVAATDRVVVVGNYEDIDGVAWRQVIRL